MTEFISYWINCLLSVYNIIPRMSQLLGNDQAQDKHSVYTNQVMNHKGIKCLILQTILQRLTTVSIENDVEQLKYSYIAGGHAK